MSVLDGERRALTLPGTPASIRRARQFVLRAVADWCLPGIADDAALLVSEVATNAVLHARSPFEVVVQRRGGVARISVLDASADEPVRRHSGLQAGGGRGVALMDTLAAQWGSTPPSELGRWTKGVWFELTAGGSGAGEEGALYGQGWPVERDTPTG